MTTIVSCNSAISSLFVITEQYHTEQLKLLSLPESVTQINGKVLKTAGSVSLWNNVGENKITDNICLIKLQVILNPLRFYSGFHSVYMDL